MGRGGVVYITVEESCRSRLDITIISLTNSKYQFTKLLHSHESIGSAAAGESVYGGEDWSNIEHVSGEYQRRRNRGELEGTGGNASERAWVFSSPEINLPDFVPEIRV